MPKEEKNIDNKAIQTIETIEKAMPATKTSSSIQKLFMLKKVIADFVHLQ